MTIIYIYIYIYIYIRDRISAYNVHSIMIDFIIKLRYQSVLGIDEVQTPAILFNDKRFY